MAKMSKFGCSKHKEAESLRKGGRQEEEGASTLTHTVLRWPHVYLKRHTSPAMICKSSKYGVVKSSNCQCGALFIAILMEDTAVPTVCCAAVTRLPEFALETDLG